MTSQWRIVSWLSRSRLNSSVVRFVLAGGFSFLVDFGLLALLHQVLGLSLWFATGAAFLASFFIAYFLQRIFAFTSTSPHGSTLVRYSLLVALNSLATVGIVALSAASALGWERGKVAAAALTTIWNFFAYRYWVFRPTIQENFPEA